MYVYIEFTPGVFQTGFYSPDGRWNNDLYYYNREAAAKRVSFLNGGNTIQGEGHETIKGKIENKIEEVPTHYNGNRGPYGF